jgi:hypothetical protein
MLARVDHPWLTVAGEDMAINFDNLEMIIEEALVVGVQHNRDNGAAFYQAAKEALAYGSIEEDIGIVIKRDPGNPHDAYAVQVLGKWPHADGRKKSALLGFLSKEMAWRVGQETDPADKLNGEMCTIEPNSEFGFDLRVNVYVKYEV